MWPFKTQAQKQEIKELCQEIKELRKQLENQKTTNNELKRKYETLETQLSTAQNNTLRIFKHFKGLYTMLQSFKEVPEHMILKLENAKPAKEDKDDYDSNSPISPSTHDYITHEETRIIPKATPEQKRSWAEIEKLIKNAAYDPKK